jgi:hypothetical protein
MDCSDTCGCASKKQKLKPNQLLEPIEASENDLGDRLPISNKTSTCSRSKRSRKTKTAPTKIDEESDRESRMHGHSEIKEDSRRIWVDNPEVENGGFWRTDPRSKATDPSPAKSFVSQQEFRRLTLSHDNEEPGFNSSYFVKDPKGKLYLYKEAVPQGLDDTAAEILVSELAESAGILANRTRLVPASLESRFKKAGAEAGTLHSIVPGVALNKDPKIRGMEDADELCLEMDDTSPASNEDCVRSLIQHPDLARIAALDVFTSNLDRHRGNYFYHESKHQFHAIDLGGSFTVPNGIASTFAKTVHSMSYDLEDLTSYERRNLKVFADTLAQLKQENPPASLQNRLMRYTMAASSRSNFEKTFQKRKPDIDQYNQLRETNLIQAQKQIDLVRTGLSSTSRHHVTLQASLLQRLTSIERNHAHTDDVIQAVRQYL